MGRSFCSAVAAVVIFGVCAGAAGQRNDVPSAADFQVFPTPAEGPTITPLLQAQIDAAWAFDRARERRWDAIRTEQELRAEQGRLRRELLISIGGLPPVRTPLHAQIAGVVRENGFHVEKLIYQSLPGIYVTALVYVPEDGRIRHGAVLVPAGHATDGKIHYQLLCQRLVKSGYVVLSWDPVGQGERSQFWDVKRKRSRYNLICAEHAVLGNEAYLHGQSLARYEIWDAMRGLDYLLSRPDVDGSRIAITGTSGGGFQTAMIAALDTRIGVVIPSCYITAMPMRIGNRIFRDPDSDPEQDPAGFVSAGIDHAGLLLSMYPRPVLIAAATLDFFPIEGTHKTFGEVQALYARFGYGGRVGMVESYNEHAYSVANQEAALRFLAAQWGTAVGPPPTVREIPDDQLICTKSGQVSVDFANWTPLADQIRRSAKKSPLTSARLRALYMRLRAGEPKTAPVLPDDGGAVDEGIRWRLAGSSRVDGATIDRYVIRYSRYFAMPLLFIHNSGAPERNAVIAVGPDGKLTPDDWPAIEDHLRRGEAVVTFDYRAQGENAMPYRVRGDDPSLNPGDWRKEYGNPLSSVLADYVYNSIILGQPYFLDKLEDIDIARRFTRGHLGISAPRVEIRGDDVMLWGAKAVFGESIVEGSSAASSYGEAQHGATMRIDDLVPSALLNMQTLR